MTLLDASLDAAALQGRVHALVSTHPPSEVAPERFWSARFDAGLASVDLPVGLGGLGADPALQPVVDAALAAAGAPRIEERNLIGVQMMAPTIGAFGTADQAERWLRPAFTGAEIWCQLFSEPGAGSDLASLSTRAVQHDDGSWRLDGQKVWTTLAHLADRAICIARTDPTVAKHKGLTFFAVDMHAAGVEVRPLRQISGEAEYNEVFLTDVVVPDADRIGAPGSGWSVTMATLASERSVVADMASGAAMDVLLDRLRATWAAADSSRRTAAHRDRVARLFVEATVVGLTAVRPELPPSMTKIGYGELAQRLAEACLDLAGPAGALVDHYDLTQPDRFTHVGGAADDELHPTKAFLVAQALTIAGGTTNVNKNVLAERVLGLPPEPRPPAPQPRSPS
ncbi:MAG: acyl-CoA dehydrogenase family protein [Actinomycetota bacterium]|nr:acyl-CoA dehydrogenase family protein [Acidimicrobiia bacterium]MDQ3292861.1 acyl-CoA dehydrogenase family protein [Actinomycetota bacterium]